MSCTIAIILVRLWCGAFAEAPIDSTDSWIENPRVYTVAEQYYLCRNTTFAEQASRSVYVNGEKVRHLYREEWDVWCGVLFEPNGDIIWNAIMSFRDHRFSWDGSFLEGLHRCEWDNAIAVDVREAGFTVRMCVFVRDIERVSGPIPYDWRREKHGMPSDYSRWRRG